MHKLLFAALLICSLCSCNKNCDSEYAALDKQYQTALQDAGGSQAAIDQVTADYNARKAKLDCD